MISELEDEKLNLAQEIELLEISALKFLKKSNEEHFCIQKNHLEELKHLRIPVQPIVEIIKAVAYLLGYNNYGNWDNLKKISYDSYFLIKLIKLHEDFIMTDKIKEIIYPILYESNFDVYLLRSYSLAIYSLYIWADNFVGMLKIENA